MAPQKFFLNKLPSNFPLICLFHLGCKVLQNFPQTLGVRSNFISFWLNFKGENTKPPEQAQLFSTSFIQ